MARWPNLIFIFYGLDSAHFCYSYPITDKTARSSGFVVKTPCFCVTSKTLDRIWYYLSYSVHRIAFEILAEFDFAHGGLLAQLFNEEYICNFKT